MNGVYSHDELAGLWKEILFDIEQEVSQANFVTWFKDTYPYKESDGVLFITVPNEFAKTWLLEKFHKMVVRVTRQKIDTIRGVEYIVGKPKHIIKEPSKKNGSVQEITNQMPLSQLYVDKSNNLNPRYTFENFVVGPFNELAYAAAQAVIKNPGRAYNPLFVYGKTGHGKTHLIQSIGNHLKASDTHPKVFYVTSEKFSMDYVSSLKNNSIDQFKSRYRKYDVLIMDDIQFLSNKEKTQEELFHLFNALYEENKQIVFSSDMHPNYLSNMEERLRSRFSAGMILDIPQPDIESRFAILQSKAHSMNLFIDDDIIHYVAEVIEGNIRELEGVLNSLVVYSEVKKDSLTLNDVKNLIKNNIKTKKTVPIESIIRVIADYYGIDQFDITKKSRKKEVVKPRQIAMFILREDFSIPYPTIGQHLGGRDHTTVIHSYEKIKHDLKTDSDLSHELSQIRAML